MKYKPYLCLCSLRLRFNFADSRFVSASLLHNYASATSVIINEMIDAATSGSTNNIPRIWRMLLYALSLLGFGKVATSSWLPAKLRRVNIVCHGCSKVIQSIHAFLFSVGFRLDGALNSLIQTPNFLSLDALWRILIYRKPLDKSHEATECMLWHFGEM